MPTAIGQPMRRYSATRFRGLDVKSSPQELASNPKFRDRLTLARNIVFPKTGGASKRFDAVQYNTTTLGATVTIIGGVQFRHSNGTDYNICAADDGTIRRLNTNGTTTTLASGLTTTPTQAFFAQFNDLLIYGDRVNAPRSYDGTTEGALAGTPPATGGPWAVHGNRVFALDATNRRRVSWCALNDAEDWTAAGDAGSMTVSGRNGSPLVFLLPLTNELELGHRDFVTRLQGTSPATFAITNAVPAQVSTGGISFAGAAFGANDGWYVSQRGLHRIATTQAFGDLREEFASETIDPFFTAGTDYTLSLNQLTLAVLAYDTQNNRVYLGVDNNNDGENDTVLCLDVFLNLATKGDLGWSVWTGLSCASLWPVYTGVNAVEMFMGGYDGFVRRLNVDDDENAINARFNHITDLNDPGWQKNLRHLRVYAKEEGNYNLTITANADFGASGGQTFTMSLLGDTDVLGSTFELGTSVLGARSQLIKEMDMGVLGEFFEIGFSNQQAGENFTVHKYEAQFRRRRLLTRGSAIA